jgi:hypothetical protein
MVADKVVGRKIIFFDYYGCDSDLTATQATGDKRVICD